MIANGVDVEYFRHDGSPTVPGNLVMASGMNWFPNRDAVLYMCTEIWPLLSAKMPELTWTIVGASPPQQVVDLAARDPRVVVTGFVDDVRPYLSRAEIYLCPMRDGGGTRVKILDALAMAKPIVSTTMGCEGIDVTPGVDVLIADTPDAFVSADCAIARRRSPAPGGFGSRAETRRRSVFLAGHRSQSRHRLPPIGRDLTYKSWRLR